MALDAAVIRNGRPLQLGASPFIAENCRRLAKALVRQRKAAEAKPYARWVFQRDLIMFWLKNTR
jgi:hypothetical protein